MPSEPVYAAAAQLYRDAGWLGVLPVPPNKKWPPPNGFTGNDGVDPSGADVYEWTEQKPDWNICLRLPPDMIGIDVDAYEGKNGAATLARAEELWGPLPDTWTSSSRIGGQSGIRFFRIPTGTRLRDRIDLGDGLGDIEIVQAHHRYAVVWPSIHPNGDRYDWLAPDYASNDDLAPGIDHIYPLPQRWIDALEAPAITITAEADVGGVLANLPQGRMSVGVERLLDKAIQDLASRGSRHDTTRDNVLRLLREAERGEPGIGHALERLKRAYVIAVSNRADALSAELEFDRMVTGQRGHDLIASTPTPDLLGLVSPAAPNPAMTTPPVPVSAVSITYGPGNDPENETPAAAAERFDDIDDMLGLNTEVVQKPAVESGEPERRIPRHISISDLAGLVPPAPLVDRLLYAGTLAQIAGAPGTYKTFLSLSLACAVASPLDRWQGYNIKTHGPVLYVAAEGASGLRTRVLAWCEYNDVDPGDINGRLEFYPEPIQIGSRSSMAELAADAIEFGAVLIVFDTRARCSLAMEENSASEQGEAVEAAEMLRRATGATVLMVHHSSRSGTAGRGSNAWDGALWTDLRVLASERAEDSTELVMKVEVEKHKDVESGMVLEFELEHHSVSPGLMPMRPGTDPFIRNTLVVTHRVPTGATDSETLVLKYLKGCGRLTGSELRDMVMGHGVHRATALRAIKKLAEQGRIKRSGTEQRAMYEIRELGK